MNVLQKLKVSHAIGLMVLLPFAIILLFVWVIIANVNNDIHAANLSEQVVELSEIFDNVAHTHAVERGVTAGFLGSKGSKNKDKLAAVRQKADAAEQALKSLNVDDYQFLNEEDFNKLTQDLVAKLKGKASVRTNVDNLAVNTVTTAFRKGLKNLLH